MSATPERICVFCGSNSGTSPTFAAVARSFGRLLARKGLGLVYGGGNVGLMGEVAEAVLAEGGEVIGVIPRSLVEREVAHDGLTELVVVRTMHERKARMAELARAFVALPGGFGTFDEICEMITWAQLGIHRKPCALLDVEGYYRPLLELFDRAVAEGFIRPAHRELVLVDADPGRLLERIDAWRAPELARWSDLDEV